MIQIPTTKKVKITPRLLRLPPCAKIIDFFFEEALKLAQWIIEGVKTALPKVLAATGHPEDSVKEATGVVAEAVMLLCACSKTEEESVNTTALAICILDSRMF